MRRKLLVNADFSGAEKTFKFGGVIFRLQVGELSFKRDTL